MKINNYKFLKSSYILTLVLIVCFIFNSKPLGGQTNFKKLNIHRFTDQTQYKNYLNIKYLLNLHLYEDAEALINQHLKQYPEDPFILTEKAFLYSEIKGKIDDALNFLKKALYIYPEYYSANYLYSYILYSKTQQAIDSDPSSKKELDDALHFLEIANKNNPSFFDAFYLRGVILNIKKKYKESNRVLFQGNRLKQSVNSYLYMVSNYKELNDEKGVINSYKEILSFKPFNYQALNTLSKIYLSKRNFKAAAIYLEKLFLNYPTHQNFAVDYLYALFSAGEFEKYLKITNDFDITQYPSLIYAKALILTQKKNYSEAQILLESLKSKDLKSQLLLADIHLSQYNYFSAYEVLESVKPESKNYLYYSMHFQTLSLLNLNQRIINLFNSIQKNSSLIKKLTSDDYYTLILAASNLNDVNKTHKISTFAKKYLKDHNDIFLELELALTKISQGEKISKHALKNEMNIMTVVAVLKNQKRYNESISLLNLLLKKKKNTPHIFLELCDIYLDLNKTKKLESLLKKLLKKFPSSIIIKNFYAYYLAIHHKELKYALQLSSQTLAEKNNSAAILDTYGYILLRLGRPIDAKKYLEMAYKKQPFDREIMNHLIELYSNLKDPKQNKIKNIYEKAIQHNVDFKDQLIIRLKKLKNE